MTLRSITGIVLTSSLVFFYCSAAELTIEVEIAEPGRGEVAIGVWASPEEFLKTATLSVVHPVGSHSTVTALVDLPPGQYAISAYQDLDSDGELDSGMFRIPKEPTGFSNNARGLAGPPSFEKAAFDLPVEGRTIRFSVK